MDVLFLAAQPMFRGFWGMVMLAGMLKSFQIACRPRTHTLCCVALGLVPAAWIVLTVYDEVAPLVADDRAAKLVTAVGFLGCAALVDLAALVLGIVGVVHVSLNAANYDQGRKQGIWAIVLSLALAALMGAAITSVVRARMEAAGPQPLPNASAVQRFEELNFSYTPPGSPWVAVDPSKLNPRAKVGVIDKGTRTVFFVLANEVGNLADPEGTLRELALVDLRGVGGDFELVSDETSTYDGRTWLHLVGRATIPAGRMTYHTLVLYHRGFAYQTFCFAREEDDSGLAGRVERAMRGFSILDPERYGGSLSMHGDFSSPCYGYAMPALDLPWQRWTEEELAEYFAEAELGLSYGADQGQLAVVPLHLGGGELPQGALVDALLSALEVDPGDSDLVRVAGEGDAWATYTYEREQDGVPFRYRLRLVREPERALLALAWWDARYEEGIVGPLTEALERLELRPVDAWDPADLGERDRAWHGAAYRRIGTWFSQRERYAEAAEWLERGYACSPDMPLLTRWLSAVRNGEGVEAALQVLRPRLAAHAEDSEVLSWWGYLNLQAGKPQVARAAYARAFELGHENVYDLIDYARLLRDLDALDEACALLEAHQDLGPQATETHARLLAEADLQAALALVLARDPEGTRFPTLRMELYHDAGLFAKAVELGEARVAAGQANGDTHLRLGKSLLELRWLQRAKAEFELALRLGTDDDAQVRRYLQHVESLLGEGNREALRDPIEPVPFPEHLLADAPAATPSDESGGARYLLRTRAVRFVPGEILRETRRLRLQVLDDGAAAGFSTLTYDVDPTLERVYVNRLQVRDASGEVVAEGEPGEHYLSAKEAADTDRVLNVTVPGLQPGRVIDLVLTRERRSPPSQLPLFSHAFSQRERCDLDGFYLEVDPALVTWHGSAAAPATRALEGGLAWVATSPRRFTYERLQPSYSSLYPYLQVAGRSTWAEVGRGYLELLAERLPPPEEVQELAARLVREDQDPAARVDALADHVRRLLTYKAIEFGIRGRVPHPSTKTLERRYGDCKDHALLLYQLLRAADVRAHLVLVDVDDPVVPELPTLDAFDHMVVYVPDVRGGLLVDTTDKNLATALTPVPYGLGGRRGLLLDPEGPRLIRARDYPADSNRVRVRRRVRLDAEDLVVEEQLELRGYYAGYLRGRLRGADAEDARLELEAQLDDPALELETVEVAQAEAIDRPLVLELRYRVRDAVHAADALRVGALPAPLEASYFWQRDEARTHPFELEYPLELSGEVELVGAEASAFDAHEGGALLEYEARLQPTPTGSRLTYRLQRAAGRWESSRWQALVEAQRAALDRLRARFRASAD